jgi:hypothetical protein
MRPREVKRGFALTRQFLVKASLEGVLLQSNAKEDGVLEMILGLKGMFLRRHLR